MSRNDSYSKIGYFGSYSLVLQNLLPIPARFDLCHLLLLLLFLLGALFSLWSLFPVSFSSLLFLNPPRLCTYYQVRSCDDGCDLCAPQTWFSRTYCLASRKAALKASALSTVANLIASVCSKKKKLLLALTLTNYLLLGLVLFRQGISKVSLSFPNPRLQKRKEESYRAGHFHQRAIFGAFLPFGTHSWVWGPSTAEWSG